MNIIFGGGFLGPEGLCIMGREIIKQLTKIHNVNIDAPEISGYWEQFYNNFKNEEEDIYILNGHIPKIPLIFTNHKTIIPIVVFETDIPQDWIESLKHPAVKEIWTISEFNKKNIEQANINKPIKVLNLGVDERFKEKGMNLFPKDKSFKFLHVSAPHCKSNKDRKGLDVLVNAFKQAFGNSEEVKLILKLNMVYARQFNSDINIQKYIYNLLPKGTNIKNISISIDYYKTPFINHLYESVDCGVFPSRAEGHGFPQCEMLCKGIPVITTNYGATNEFSLKSLRVNVKKMTTIGDGGFPYYNSLFADPDLDDLKIKMIAVHLNHEYYTKQTIKLAKEILKKYSWDNCGKQMNQYLKEK